MNKTLALAIQVIVNSRQAEKNLEHTGSAMAKMQSRFIKMESARETLGIRSERLIQREIKKTEAAYNRLERSGKVGARELGRAYDAMQQKLSRLRREMEGVTRIQKAINLGKTGAAIGAGVATGAYVMAQPIKKVMEYDRALAMASNTLNSEKNASGRIAGIREINAAVERAVNQGGGNRDDALGAYSSLVGSGALGDGAAARQKGADLLPIIQKYQTGTGAESADLSEMATKATAFGIAIKDMSYAMDMAISGGNDGGMELKDLARWLPSQMQAASRVGMSGNKDYAKLVALNEVAFLGAGTRDEAGNNVRNLANKLSSEDTRKDLSRAGHINLDAELIKGRAKGLDAFDVMAEQTRKVMEKDKRYVALQKKLAATGDKDEQRKILEAQAAIINGSAIGKVMNDQQAGSALAALIAFGNKAKLIQENALKNRGIGETNFETIAASDSYKVERAKNQIEFRQRDALEGLTHAIGDASGKLADYALKYPGLSTAIVGATTALTALAAAGAGAAASSWLTRGAIGSAGGTATGAIGGASTTGAVARWGAGLLPWVARLAKVGVVGQAIFHSDSLGTDKNGNQLDTPEGLFAAYGKGKGPSLTNVRKSVAASNAAYAAKFDMSGRIKVEVDVKNNTATVTPSFKDRQVQSRIDAGRSMPTVTAAIRG